MNKEMLYLANQNNVETHVHTFRQKTQECSQPLGHERSITFQSITMTEDKNHKMLACEFKYLGKKKTSP